MEEEFEVDVKLPADNKCVIRPFPLEPAGEKIEGAVEIYPLPNEDATK